MAAPILPQELQDELEKAAISYATLIPTRQYDAALNIVKNLYDKMLSWQRKYGERFHKGYPLHNIGYTLHLQNKQGEAIEYFLLAYIEDLLSADVEDEADSTPAGQTLITGYKFNPTVLKSLKQIVAGFKGRNIIPSRPEMVLQELKDLLEKSKTGYQDVKAQVKVIKREASFKPFAKFESEWERRVFVGGSIGLEFIIKYIAEIVRKLGYDPIVCTEFEDPEGLSSHDKCLVLLHNCKYAVFDVAEQVGQLMELERVGDYHGVETLVIWPKNKEKAITEMLKSYVDLQKFHHDSYSENADIKSILYKFLPRYPSQR